MTASSDLERFSSLTDQTLSLLESRPLLICTAYRPLGLVLELILHRSRLQGKELPLLGICTRGEDAELRMPAAASDALVITSDLLEDGSCLPLVRQLRERSEPPQMIVSLITPHRATLESLLHAGVEAVVAQENYEQGCLLQALEAMRRGEQHVDPRCRELLDEPLRARDELTAREVEVLQLVATGLTNRGIAGQLGIAESTARDHVQRILHKLAVADRTAAAVEGIHRGYVI